MPALPCPGLHHVTAICSDAQANAAFYAGTLGLRLVKRTVNFDDPGSYHLYYGDHTGRPGSLLTFFAWPGARRGRPGVGQVSAVCLAVPAASLGFWGERLASRGVAVRPEAPRFGEPILAFADPDGLSLELAGVAAVDPAFSPPPGSGVPAAHAVRGVRTVTLLEREAAPTAALLTNRFGYQPAPGDAAPAGYHRFLPSIGGAAGTSAVDLLVRPDAPAGNVAVGNVHHVAFRARDDAEQTMWRAELAAAGLGVSPVMDRTYFRSIYFREPGGVLFEVATDRPGFAVDETLAELGRTLRLPPALEAQRADIERNLPPLTLPA